MIKIQQDNLNSQSLRKQGIQYSINTSHIRLKVQNKNSYVGLFLNNNPYLINPTFNSEGYWDLDTQNKIFISSIKFDLKTNVNVLVEAFYEE